MKNVLLVFISAVIIMFASCVSKNNQDADATNGTHKVVVKEILQANSYTYLNVTENKKDQWIAVPSMEAQVGDIFFFDGFMEMNNFESKDLGRTFESVYFIQELRTEESHAGHDHGEGDGHNHGAMPAGHGQMEKHEGKPEITKAEIKIDPVEGGITIGELFANAEKYKGKKVIVRGKVVKVNYEIMNKNWFHLQDGTSADGKFDLTITSLENDVEVDDRVTFEGVISLNKDFGYGYSYEVLMEDAVIK